MTNANHPHIEWSRDLAISNGFFVHCHLRCCDLVEKIIETITMTVEINTVMHAGLL